jgi:hypothetical protein
VTATAIALVSAAAAHPTVPPPVPGSSGPRAISRPATTATRWNLPSPAHAPSRMKARTNDQTRSARKR